MTAYLGSYDYWQGLAQTQTAQMFRQAGIPYGSSTFTNCTFTDEPEQTPPKKKTLHNCTFHELLDEFKELVGKF